jgi:hypothetical protein
MNTRMAKFQVKKRKEVLKGKGGMWVSSGYGT